MSDDNLEKLHDVIVQKIITIRKKKKVTQKDIANALGKSQAFVAKLESGRIRLNLQDFIAICCFLDIKKASFFQSLENVVADRIEESKDP